MAEWSAGGDAGKYDFAYAPGTPYAHAVALVERWRASGGQVVVDLGCGFGAIADPVRALGLSYLGVDMEPAGVQALCARDIEGVEAVVGDLGEPETLFSQVSALLAGRRVAAFTMLDAIEHLPHADDFLAALRGFAASLGDAGAERGPVPLVVSIPNVSHRDLAAKLLVGRWDVTPTGLLDATHVRFFAPGTLAWTMAAAGWEELEAHDFELEASDQHFPADSVALSESTPLGSYLRRVRGAAGPGATTNQFVRAYRPGAPVGAGAASGDLGGGTAAPFLSVVVRTAGTRTVTFDDLLLSLAAQSCDDFEVVVVACAPEPVAVTALAASIEEAVARYDPGFGARVNVVHPQGGGPGALALHPLDAAASGIARARGRYVVILTDDQVPFGHWVEMLATTASQAPGRVVHVGVATQRAVLTDGGFDLVDRPRCADSFDVSLATLLAAPALRLCGYALPRSAFFELGLRFDGTAASEWMALVRAVEQCGITTTGAVGILQREWTGAGGDSDRGTTTGAGADARARLIAALDQEPLLLDRGGASLLLAAAQAKTLERARHDAEARLAAVHASTSWRVTAPLRAAIDRWRQR